MIYMCLCFALICTGCARYDEILKGNYKNEGGGGDKKESSNSEGGAPKAEQKMDESYESATTDEDVEILDLDLEEDGHDEM